MIILTLLKERNEIDYETLCPAIYQKNTVVYGIRRQNVSSFQANYKMLVVMYVHAVR